MVLLYHNERGGANLALSLFLTFQGFHDFKIRGLASEKRNVPRGGDEFGRVKTRFGADDFAVHNEVKTRFLWIMPTADLKGEERTVNREVFGDGFSGGGGTLVEGREIALADDARNQRIASLVHKGFLG